MRGCSTCTATPLPPPVEDNVSQDERARIERAVLNRLGRPTDLHSCHAVRVYGDNWRVNVRRTLSTDTLCPVVRITDTFFLRGGSVDEIERKY